MDRHKAWKSTGFKVADTFEDFLTELIEDEMTYLYPNDRQV